MNAVRSMWTIDQCPDANRHWTVRPSDGTPNGDIESQPIATVYDLRDAEQMVQEHNKTYMFYLRHGEVCDDDGEPITEVYGTPFPPIKSPPSVEERRRQVVELLLEIGHPELRSSITVHFGWSAGMASTTYRDPRFVLAKYGLLWLTGRRVPPRDAEISGGYPLLREHFKDKQSEA